MLKNPLITHKNKPRDLSQTIWWKPLFETQRQMARSSKDLFKGTPLENLIETQENFFEQAQKNCNSAFGEVFNNRQMISPILFGNNTEPYIDIVENKDSFKVKAEIPGVKESDLDISIVDGGLMIEGEKYMQCTDKGENYVHKECHAGYFSRTIALPEDADLDKARAELSLSVLTIEVPKKAHSKKQNNKKLNVESKPVNNQKEKKIEIKTAA